MGFLNDLVQGAEDFYKAKLDFYRHPGAAWSSIKRDPIGSFILIGGDTAMFVGRRMWYKLMAPPSVQQQPIEGNKQSNSAKRPVIYGQRGKVGGNQDFIHTYGGTNEFLWILLDICEGPIESIDEVYIDDILSTDAKYSGKVAIYKHLGELDQAAPAELVAALPTYFTAAHRLRGVAYVAVRFTYNPDSFSGFPQITCNIKGRKVYDTRTLATAYSANPALCVRDYVLNNMYGKGLNPLLLNDDYISAAANYCDTQVVIHTGTVDTFALLECNAYLDTEKKIIDNLRTLLASCRAGFPKVNGKYCLIVERDYFPVTFSFDESNIIGGWSISGGDVSTKLNDIEITYVNKDLGWKDDVVPVTSPILFEQDGDITLTTSISAEFITDQYRAKDLANLEIKRSRQQLSCAFVAAPAALNVVPGSIVDVTHASVGFAAKKFRVVDVTIIPHGLVGVSLIEHYAETYDRTVPIEYVAPADTVLPDPNNVIAPGVPILDSGDAWLLLANDGTVISRIRAAWVAPVGYPYATGYDTEFKKTGTTEWAPGPSVMASSGQVAFIGPVDDGALYDVRVRTVGPGNRRSPWATTVGHSVIGKLTPPPDVTSFLVKRQPDGTREFAWSMASPPADLAGYRIKYALSSGHTWDELSPLHNGLLTASPFESNQLAAGIYTIGIKAVDTSGNESASAVLIDSTLGDPRIAGSLYYTQAEGVAPIWPGLYVGGSNATAGFFLDEVNGVLLAKSSKTWADFATDGIDWSEWTSWNRAPVSPCIYEHPVIDLGAVLSFTPLITAEGTGSIVIETAFSDDDVTYTSWAVPGGLVAARYIKIKVTVTSTPTPAVLSALKINMSADPVDEYLNDINTATYRSAGVLRLPITRTYSTITQVSVALQNTTGGGWTWKIIDKSVSQGPCIEIYDSTGAVADCVIDAYVKGV